MHRNYLEFAGSVRRSVWIAGASLVLGCALVYTLACLMLPHGPLSPRELSERTLRVGYAEFAPYITLGEDGKPSGLAVQLLQQAAQRSGVVLQWIAVESADRALREGSVDVFPILTVTPEREREFVRGEPWWESSRSLLSLRDHPLLNLSETAGKKIGIRDTAAIAPIAARFLAGADRRPMHTPALMLAGLCAGELDGVLLDGRLIYEALLNRPDACGSHRLLMVPAPETTLSMTTFARKGVKPAAGQLFAAIEDLSADGTLTILANRWFALPQQRSGRERLAERMGKRMYLVGGAAGLLFGLLSFWYARRATRMRRAGEEALARAQEAELRFEGFMWHSPAACTIKDSSGRTVYVNQAAANFLGASPQEIFSRTDEELWGAGAQTVRNSDAQVLSDGKPAQYHLPLMGQDGQLHHWLVLKFVLKDERGQVLLGTSAVNITDQQHAADLVARSEERYRALFDQAPVAIHEIDAAGFIVRVNQAGCLLTGYSVDEIVGHHASDFVSPERREKSRKAVRDKLSGLQALVPFERTFQRKDGCQFPVEVHETAILGAQGEILGLRSFLVDLTERYESRRSLDAFAVQLQQNNTTLARALEEAQQATRLKSQFLANMSHEIRTPMSGVLGMAELLLSAGLTPDQRSLALSISQSGEHLLNIINDILDLSKIEAGKLELEHAPFSLPGVVEAAIELMAPAAQAKGLELTCWVDPAIPFQLVGDAARLRQVLLNLIGNAVKFTPSGDIAVRVEMEPAGQGAPRVRVEVADTGIGIAASSVAHLFKAFSQADNSTTRHFGGTGLGLAIAKSIVELMQGEIGVETQAGRGSTFWFTATLAAESESHPAPAPAPLPPAYILIVASHPGTLAILERYATVWGLYPHIASSAQAALLEISHCAHRGEALAAVIVDLQMPEREGVELARKIAHDPALHGLPLLCLTGAGVLLECEPGFVCLTKPVKPGILRETLNQLLHPATPPASLPTALASVKPSATSRGRILIAEDNPVNQRVASLQVKRFGFESDVVGNGEEALAALERLAYTLVLMDCQMPGMDGYAATRELRRRENGARHTPVIALTANAYAADREACIAAGMDDHLAKPVTLRDLGAVLDRWSDR